VATEYKFRFDWKNVEMVLGQLRDRIVPFMRATFRSFVESGVDFIQEAGPEVRQGRTPIKTLWVSEQTASGAVDEFVIRNTYNNQDVIVWFEFGTRAHDIPVGRCGFLHFTTYEGDEVYTRKTVKHPGTRPWLMVTRTKAKLDAALNTYVEKTLASIDELIGAR
jgi:hypothetical protein